MKNLFLLFLFLSPSAHALTPIEMDDLRRTAGRAIINISVAPDGREWVYQKVMVRHSSQSSPALYCFRGRSLSSITYGPVPDMSLLTFYNTYGLPPALESVEFLSIPWCEQ